MYYFENLTDSLCCSCVDFLPGSICCGHLEAVSVKNRPVFTAEQRLPQGRLVELAALSGMATISAGGLIAGGTQRRHAWWNLGVTLPLFPNTTNVT